MKQETFITRLTVLLLFVGLAAYFGIYTYNSLNDPFSSALCYTHTVDEAVEVTGYVIREEVVLPRQNGVVDILPEEGEKVASGETVAVIYKDPSALEQKLAIRELELELEQLEYSLRQDSGRGDVVRLDQDILNAVVKLRGESAVGDFSRLEENAMQLKSMVFHRSYTYSNNTESVDKITAMIKEVSGKLKSLETAMAQEAYRVNAPEPGIFSGQVDGYETVLTADMVDTLTVGQLENVEPLSIAQEGQTGKLITDSRWYFAAALPQEEIRGLKEGDRVTIRFSRDRAGEAEGRVLRIGEAEGDLVPVVIAADRKLSQVTLLRKQIVELILESTTGIRVPKSALRVEENEGERETVVYAVVGQQAERKNVTILAEEEDFYLVEPQEVENPQNTSARKKSLRPGDEIIVNAKNLYDGKVVK